ncbi:hypothetical protein [Aquimarina algicola]|uniref:VCBS repeat-containing protein n=1 Tax=Aquimarina algicola TaxID=2589995 RepID=A0A504JG75_9FLAO|nr:hypothetical protein [Aquimarina algicola]TPN87692.1 hypothetical protein FHK87_08940 [Aquimarina algicola]
MNNIKNIIILLFGVAFTGCINNNPYKGVKWIRDYPGATNRHVTYTPVLKTDNSIILGPTIGADFGKLKFKDIDNDGIKEVIIETDYLYTPAEFHSPVQHILKSTIDDNGLTKFELISTKELEKD